MTVLDDRIIAIAQRIDGNEFAIGICCVSQEPAKFARIRKNSKDSPEVGFTEIAGLSSF